MVYIGNLCCRLRKQLYGIHRPKMQNKSCDMFEKHFFQYIWAFASEFTFEVSKRACMSSTTFQIKNYLSKIQIKNAYVKSH